MSVTTSPQSDEPTAPGLPLLYNLVYCSRAVRPVDEAVLSSIIESAHRHNSRMGITGLLTCGSGLFFQWLEGPRDNVTALMSTLRADPRHDTIVTLSETEEVRERVFPQWDMEHVNADDIRDVLNDAIDTAEDETQLQALRVLLTRLELTTRLTDKDSMPANELLRPTFIVSDIDAAIAFYTFVFDWTVVFDQVIKVDKRYPPAAPDGARSRLTVFQVDDPELGTLGFMQYLDHAIPPGPSKHRKTLAQGEAILVIRAADPDLCYERIKRTEAVVIGPPADWEVVGERPGEVIKLRTMSLCDPNGIYIEVNRRDPKSEWPAPAASLK